MSSKDKGSMKKLFAIFAVIVVLAGFLIFIVCASKEESLQLVHVLFRHGERSPSESYKTDPFKDYPWPGGWDQLSLNGKKQEYQLGLQLRKRYKNFLPNGYETKTFLIESSYADRCLMSAQLMLAGLFPPVGDDIWNDNLLWQPIPVHSLPRSLDNKIAIKKTCPVFLKALNESYEELVDENAQNRNLYDYLSENTGDEIRNIRTLETLYNTLEIERLNGFDLPEWTESVFPDTMKPLAASSLALFTKTTMMKRLHGGILVKEILNNMEDKIQPKLKGETGRKMIMYSGHDLTVVTLLRVLGFPELIKPDFGASVIVELHKYNTNEYVVKFFYMENPQSAVEELHLDGCSDSGCLLSTLRTLLAPVLPDDWEKECIL